MIDEWDARTAEIRIDLEKKRLKAYGAIYSYIQEKGIEVGWNVLIYKPAVFFSIFKAPPKVYHEVLVPGLRDLCKRLNVTILPDKYERTEEGCTLEGIMKWRSTKQKFTT